MTEMIERVARALCREAGVDEEAWRGYGDSAAIAAIEALRDLPGEPGPRYTAGEYSRRNIEAMVDDALSAGNGGEP